MEGRRECTGACRGPAQLSGAAGAASLDMQRRLAGGLPEELPNVVGTLSRYTRVHPGRSAGPLLGYPNPLHLRRVYSEVPVCTLHLSEPAQPAVNVPSTPGALALEILLCLTCARFFAPKVDTAPLFVSECFEDQANMLLRRTPVALVGQF